MLDDVVSQNQDDIGNLGVDLVVSGERLSVLIGTEVLGAIWGVGKFERYTGFTWDKDVWYHLCMRKGKNVIVNGNEIPVMIDSTQPPHALDVDDNRLWIGNSGLNVIVSGVVLSLTG